mmetsp:Transcript_6399/g.21561  ORF Transcript_6399/g.21561 Transcript_6399/m.21561 type:complete len:769 (-) Transcript_6399:1015-3321(-)
MRRATVKPIGMGERRLAYCIRFGDGAAEDAREAFARVRWRGGGGVNDSDDDDVRVVAIGATERASDDAYVWRGDLKSAKTLERLRNAVTRETRDALATASHRGARVLVLATGVECVRGTTLTRALHLFFAFARAFAGTLDDDVEVGIVYTMRAEAPSRASSANMTFNLVHARVPARRVWPTRVERRLSAMGCEDEATTSRRASDMWCAEHARALRAAGCEVVIDDDACSATSLGTSMVFPDGVDGFYKVAFTVTEQMADVSARVYARVFATTTTTTLRDGSETIIVQSSPERWTEGGYAAEHYVTANPQPHGAYFELRDAETGADIAYIACSALQRAENDIDGRFPFSSIDSAFTSANVDRLCVLSAHRRRGAKEILLRATGDAYHALSLPLRIKTAKESVVASFEACALLAFERVKDPSANGVAKRRGEKRVVVVVPSSSRWGADDDDSRDYTQWRQTSAPTHVDARHRQPSSSGARGAAANALAAFTAALNKVTPDAVDRAARDMSSALASRADILPTCARRLARAALAQPIYAMCYARCAAALDARFQHAVVALILDEDEDVAGISALHAVGLISSSRVVDVAFTAAARHCDPPWDDSDACFKSLERAYRVLAACGKPLYDQVKHADVVRAVVKSTTPSRRERFRAAGAPTRFLFFAEDVADAIARDFQPTREGSRGFGATPNATSRRDAHRAVECEFKNVSVRVRNDDDDDDDDGVDDGVRRGERKGWVFWYVGSPIACANSSSSRYAFAGPGAPERFVRLPHL